MRRSLRLDRRGAIGGYFVAPAICIHLHVVQIETVSLIGLCVGIIFWRATPLLNMGILSLFQRWIASQGAKAQ